MDVTAHYEVEPPQETRQCFAANITPGNLSVVFLGGACDNKIIFFIYI
jgi:hypothetical protein